MIFDHIDYRKAYFSIDPRIEKAFAYYFNLNPDTPAGRYAIDGDNLFVMVQRPEKKNLNGKPLEYHRKYIDLQIVVKGSELFGYSHVSRFGEVVAPYDATRDVGLNADAGSIAIPAIQGDFFLFWPQDGHKACGEDGNADELVKLCFKMRIPE